MNNSKLSKNNKGFRRRILAACVGSALLLSGLSNQAAANAQSADSLNQSIINNFISPDTDAKPMARMWFSDAGAGADQLGLAQVRKHIQDMIDGGFGGVEIAFLSDGSHFDNEQAKNVGWGSENWRRILKEILKTANASKDGFKIDITITAHWPPIVNSIDPNDDAAAKEAISTYRKITQTDITNGRMDLPLPKQRIEDYFSGTIGAAPFLFVDKLIGATVARVADFDSDGKPVFDFESLRDVTEQTEQKMEGAKAAGFAAGVPDKLTAKAMGVSYDDIVSFYGDEPKVDIKAKRDAEGHRRRMADWQYIYQTQLTGLTSLSASSGDHLTVGDYVLFGNYYRGTGQVLSGGESVPTWNRGYATDYFSDIAVKEIFNFWDKHILDQEMKSLLKTNGHRNGTSIFEDSIEVHHDGPIWTHDLVAEFAEQHGYSPNKYLPILASGSTNAFDQPEKALRLTEDYNLVLGRLYAEEHAANISKWAKAFNYTYRAQGYTLSGLDIVGAAIALDVPEGDNSTVGDGVRQLASAVNMKGSKMLSMESTTFSANIFSTWLEIMKELNADFSQGVNRSILHGSPFARTFNGYDSKWPGWNFFKAIFHGGGFSAWNGRQIYWDEVSTASDYIARNQAVMQNGQAKVDLVVMLGTDQGFINQNGSSLPGLLDHGYSYNITSEPVLTLDNAVVIDGKLANHGPAYKAMVLKDITLLSNSAIEKILQYAKDGLPIFLLNTDIQRVYGSENGAKNDNSLHAAVESLRSLANVVSVSTDQELLTKLNALNIKPSAEYSVRGLEVTRRIAPEGEYFYFYNGRQNENAAQGNFPVFGMFGGVDNHNFAVATTPSKPGPMPPKEKRGGPPMMPPADNADGDSPPPPPGGGFGGMGGNKEYLPIKSSVRLFGHGKPFKLDPWTGSIQPIASYRMGKDFVEFELELMARESAIVVLSENTDQLPNAPKLYATDVSGGEMLIKNGQLTHRADKTDSYSITVNNGKHHKVDSKVSSSVLTLNDWKLELQSWGPDAKSAILDLEHNFGYEVDPSVSVKTTMQLPNMKLAHWDLLDVSQQQLRKLGVNSMAEVSGVGKYSTVFELPNQWGVNDGAYLDITHGSDMVTDVIINGSTIEHINQFSDRVDLGDYLRAGSNQIEIKLSTTLQNRASTAGKTHYGLTEVKLVPYRDTVIEAQ